MDCVSFREHGQPSPARLREIADLLGVPVGAFDEAGDDPEGAPRDGYLIHASSNGDGWWLARGNDGTLIVRHVGNAASGRHMTNLDLPSFLARDAGSPQQQALVSLISAALAAHLGL